jgi:MinD-like ATPase involved in chromosome partitioning or flagellar assembly
MQYGPLGGAVRVVIASDAPQAVAELDKLAGYADQVSLVGFIRHPYELDEDLEALLPDLVLLYTGFGGLDTVGLAAYLASRSARLRVMVVVDPADELFISRLEEAGAATVRADADPPSLVAAILGSVVARGSDPGGLPPVAWPGMSTPLQPAVDLPGEALARTAPATGEPVPAGVTATSSGWVDPATGVSASPEGPGWAERPPSEPDPAPTPEHPGWAGEPLPSPDATASPEAAGWEDSLPATAQPPGPESWAEPPLQEPPLEEPPLPSSVPVFQLDTAAFEPAPEAPPPAEEQWPGVPVAGAAPVPAPAVAESDPEPIRPVKPRPARRRTGRAELVVIFSGKGGVGKSLIATNLAVALAADGERVALVDLDLQFGDVAVMLHAESHPTAIDALAQQGEQVDSEFIEEVMATGPEGVRALLAPASPEFADLVNTANLRAILRELAKNYDHIVVDTPSHLEERNLEAIEMADQIVVITTFNFAAVKDTKITLKLLQSLGVDRDIISVVLNQTRAKVSFQRAEVEETLRFRVLTVLPFEPRLDDYIDNGQQIVTADPKAEFSKQFRVLVDHIAGSAQGTDAAKEPERAKPRTSRRRFSLGRG